MGESEPMDRLDLAPPPPIAYLLAVCWLVLPAVQYLGAVQRTQAAIGSSEPASLAALDLTPWYVALLGVTIGWIVLRSYFDRVRTLPSSTDGV